MNPKNFKHGKTPSQGGTLPPRAPVPLPPLPPRQPPNMILNLNPSNPVSSVQSLLTGDWVRPGMILEIPIWGFKVPITEENIEHFKSALNFWLKNLAAQGLIDRWFPSKSPPSMGGDMLMIQSLKNLFRSYMPEYANLGFWATMRLAWFE